MKFKVVHRFEGSPFEEVIFYMTEEYVFDATDMPNIQSGKLIEQVETPEMKRWKNEWSAYGQIPKVVQHLIKPKMLTWIEETQLDRKTRSTFTRIIPFYFKNVFKSETKGWYERKSDNEFLRIVEGFIDVKIPVFGPFIEEQLVAHMRTNFDIEYKITFKHIKEKFGKKK